MKPQSAEASAAVAGQMTFQWPVKGRRMSLSLAGFVALSALLHALTFYIFRVEYPPTARISPPPAQVSLLTPGSPENDALLRWIDAEDPALAAKPQELAPRNLLDVPYSPSYAEVRATPKTVAKQTQPLVYPSVKSGFALAESALSSKHEAASAAPVATKTQVRFSGELAARAPQQTPPTTNLRAQNAAAAAEVRPARFLIGVAADGEVRYIFPQHSSGDSSLDEQADAFLRGMKFARGGGDDAETLDWSFATFVWGGDVLAKSPSAAQQTAAEK